MKKRTAWILAAGVAAVAVGAAAVGGVALVLRGHGGPAGWGGGSRTYLQVDVGGDLPEQPSSELNTFLERQPPTVRQLVESIDRAAADKGVSALVLRVGFLSDAGWARVQELRDAVGRFRKSGKPAYAFVEMCGNKEYYLAAACTRIYAVPTAILDVSGLAAEVTFLKGTLDKLGVQAQFEGIGKYKNAPNQFTETGFTDPHREQTEALVDSLFGQYVSALAEGRGKSPALVQQMIDGGPYDGRQALAAGLVDELVYADQLAEKVGKGASRVTPGRYLRSARGLGLGRPKLAVIYAVGEISGGESHSGGLGGAVVGSETMVHALRQAREDDEIKAIVLRVDSPGGSGTASDVIWRELMLARRSKPVVVSMGDVAASGGYYIAMGGDAIVAEPGTITGSIGVFSGKFSLAGLYEKIGLRKELVSRGAHAAIFSEARPWDESERARIRALMSSFYEEFVKKAAEGRHRTPAEIDAVGQGRVWSGVEARAHGLVDQLGGLEVALRLAKERAHLGADQEVSLVVLPERKGFFETLFERQQDMPDDALPSQLRAALEWAVRLRGGEPLARLPFDLRVR